MKTVFLLKHLHRKYRYEEPRKEMNWRCGSSAQVHDLESLLEICTFAEVSETKIDRASKELLVQPILCKTPV